MKAEIILNVGTYKSQSFCQIQAQTAVSVFLLFLYSYMMFKDMQMPWAYVISILV